MHRWAFSTDAGPQIGQHSAPLDSPSASFSSFHGVIAANALRLEVAPALLARADEAIE